MSAVTTPIHTILALATVNGESVALVLDADAAGTAACRKWAQQAGMKLIVESGLERSRCNGQVERIHQLVERRLGLIGQRQGAQA